MPNLELTYKDIRSISDKTMEFMESLVKKEAPEATHYPRLLDSYVELVIDELNGKMYILNDLAQMRTNYYKHEV